MASRMLMHPLRPRPAAIRFTPAHMEIAERPEWQFLAAW